MSNPQHSRSETLLILLSVSLPSFMTSLDANIVAVSLPSIARSLHADFAQIEWVVSAYMLAFASLLLPAGTLADRYGRKKILLIGLALFTLASLACGLARDVTALNVARAVQGTGAALLLSAALATLSHEFRGKERAKAFGFWGSVIGIAITLGPVVGGLITQHFGWEWSFYINVPIGIGIFLLAWRVLRESRDPGADRLDTAGFVTFAGALLLLTLALISGNHAGWLSRPVILELGGSLVLFGAFLWIELRQQRPMLELRFFLQPTYIGACCAGLVYAASFYTMLTYIPMYLQGGLGYDPQKVGLYMLPIALPLFLVPRLTAKYLAHRWSGRLLLTVGQVWVAAGLLGLAMAARQFHYGPMLAGMLIAGLGAGILNGETAKVGMTVIPPERAGMAAGVGGTIRFAGILIGFAALGVVLFGTAQASLGAASPGGTGSHFREMAQRVASGDLAGAGAAWHGMPDAVRQSFGKGYHAVFLTAALFAALSAVATWLLVRASETAPDGSEASPAGESLQVE